MTSALHELIKEEKTTGTPTRVAEVRGDQAGEGDAQKDSSPSSALHTFSFADNSRLSLDQIDPSWKLEPMNDYISPATKNGSKQG
mmetsp:Transcript_9259/g.13856  ORF Transcript_9259/g.13856 Transcript_9259/m.13856 type:complete len:85 (+) Transcript_9259:49-303(+)